MEAQLTFDAADRLVDLVEERRGPVAADEAARALFALASAPTVLAHSLLDDVVSGDARLAWRGSAVALADDPTEQLPLEAARYVVVDGMGHDLPEPVWRPVIDALIENFSAAA